MRARGYLDAIAGECRVLGQRIKYRFDLKLTGLSSIMNSCEESYSQLSVDGESALLALTCRMCAHENKNIGTLEEFKNVANNNSQNWRFLQLK